jgi:hypothetical protein
MFYSNKGYNVSFDKDESQIKAIMNEYELVKKYFEEFPDLSLEERNELLNHFFDLKYYSSDILYIINSIIKNNHDTIMEIPTKMEDVCIVGFNHKSHLVYNEVNYLVSTKEKLNLPKKRYSYAELRNLYFTRQICPIYKFNKELYNFSDDSEAPKKLTTLADIGVFVEPTNEFGLYDIKFDEHGKKYQDMLFDDSRIYKDYLDAFLQNYLDGLIINVKSNSSFEDEKKYEKKLSKYSNKIKEGKK